MTGDRGILTPFQIAVLKSFASKPLFRNFYLTGGTALAAFYLHHRLSEDLDFFTESPVAVKRAAPLVKSVARDLGARIAMGRRFEAFFECSLVARQGERVEMDFALDMTGRLQPLRTNRQFLIRIDNPLDISCNKLAALYERSEPKDFADVYVISKKLFALSTLMRRARSKYPGLDDYGLAMAFSKVRDVTLWPRMTARFDPEDVRNFFMKKARRLASGIFD